MYKYNVYFYHREQLHTLAYALQTADCATNHGKSKKYTKHLNSFCANCQWFSRIFL